MSLLSLNQTEKIDHEVQASACRIESLSEQWLTFQMNEFSPYLGMTPVSLIKDTSLAYVIGVGELSFVATQVSNRVMVHPTEIFLFVALLYFLLCTSLDLAAAFLARRRRA